MADSVDALIQYIERTRASAGERSLLDHLGELVVQREAQRLVERLEGIANGRFEISETAELSAVIRWFASYAERVTWSLIIVQPAFDRFSESTRSGILRLLLDLLDDDSRPVLGCVRVISASPLTVAEDPLLIQLFLRAAACGLDVGVVAADGAVDLYPFELALSAPSNKLVISPGNGAARISAPWIVEVSLSGPPVAGIPAIDVQSRITTPVVGPQGTRGVASAAVSVESDDELSVSDLFGDHITLRDLQPRSRHLRGLDALRGPLALPAPVVPRKNEADYARVVGFFVEDLVGPDAHIIYVGDTIFNDGSVIYNLHPGAPGKVYGFLCNEKGFGVAGDFVIGPTYFSSRWRSLDRFIVESSRGGLVIGPRTVGLFDLDQTVYAAKGRDDEPLREARWEAIKAFLQDIIPSYRFDAGRTEQIYRHFDADQYHRITRDNMDYVVLLVIAVAAGLCDAREIEAFAVSRDNSIASLTELLHERALVRHGHEEIERVLEVITAVHYNTLAGDQTPCKEFRRYECQSTASKMRGSDGSGAGSRISLNCEVVDFIRFLKDRGAEVLALSDRPTEAAVLEDEDGTKEDLMSIPMKTVGFSIYDALQGVM